MLFESLKQKIVKVILTETADGYGGITRAWEESSDQIDAYIQRITSTEQQVADKDTEKPTYYIVTDAENILSYHDVVKRVSDGAIFRVLSSGSDTVSPSYMVKLGNMSQVTAERWSIDG